MTGLAAWNRLHHHYNPKTMAKMMQKIMAVVAPQKVAKVEDLVAFVELWRNK